jgi:hypothetical protein
MSNVINIKNTNIFKYKYEGIYLTDMLTYALHKFYDRPANREGMTPPFSDYYPIYHYSAFICGTMDPKYISWEQTPVVEEMYKPWEDFGFPNRFEDTLYEIKKAVIEKPAFFYRKWNSFTSALDNIDRILSTNIIITREKLTHKTIIIGFLDIKTGEFKRFLIKNVKKVCRALRTSEGDFSFLLGEPKSEHAYDWRLYPVLDVKEYDELIKPYVFSAGNIPVTNKYILTILDIFNTTPRTIKTYIL